VIMERNRRFYGRFHGVITPDLRVTCSPKTDPVVKLVFRYIIGLRKGKTHATKAIQT